jgi:hypothetical protein
VKFGTSVDLKIYRATFIMTVSEYRRGAESPDGQESGYESVDSSSEGLQTIYFAQPHLRFINQQLQKLEPEGMLVDL